MNIYELKKELKSICRCCLVESQSLRSMEHPYVTKDRAEVYSDMLVECFALNVLEGAKLSPLICEECVERLRAARDFRAVVEAATRKLVEGFWPALDIKEEPCEVLLDTGSVKCESEDWPEDDDCPLQSLVSPAHANRGKDFTNKETNKLKEKHPRRVKLSKKKSSNKIKRNVVSTPATNCEPPATDKAKRKTSSKENTVVACNFDSRLFIFKWYRDGYQCTRCATLCTTIEDLCEHAKGHDYASALAKLKNLAKLDLQTNIFTCKYCDTTSIEDFDSYKTHLLLEHGKSLKDHASESGLPFRLDRGSLQCGVCGEKFLHFTTLNIHMNAHYPNFICETCGKAFASQQRLKGHIRTHEIGDFPCRQCDKVFDRATKREHHVARCHKNGPRYACPRCGIHVPSFYARMKHLAEAHNEELKRYKCKLCPQSYVTPGHLSGHVRRDHLNERKHECDQCEAAFYTRNALVMHAVRHGGAREHVCPVCHKAYQRAKTLREHMRIHNNDKRFVCVECGRAFTQKCTLKGHMKIHAKKPTVAALKEEP